jgi:hypothetical protein
MVGKCHDSKHFKKRGQEVGSPPRRSDEFQNARGMIGSMTFSLKKETKRLLGESVREIGILALVFVPLDALIEATRATPSGAIDWSKVHYGYLGVFALISFALILVGINLEVKNEKEGR